MVVFNAASCHEGAVVSLVAMVVCRDDSSAILQTCDRSSQRLMVLGEIPDAAYQVSLLDVKVMKTQPLVCLEVNEHSCVKMLKPCTKAGLYRVTEMCSGIGGFSSQWSDLGYQVSLGVDQNPAWESTFRALHPGADFHVGAAGSSSTVQKMSSMGLEHGVVLARVSCQPFSLMGDQRGMDDDRSGSLSEVLASSWLSQAVVIILECVPPVLRNEEFQKQLADFGHLTGYHLHQQLIDLKDGWCAKRERWFGIFSAPALGPIRLTKMPQDYRFQTISKVMPSIAQWPDEEELQLSLDTKELRASTSMRQVALTIATLTCRVCYRPACILQVTSCVTVSVDVGRL